MVYCRTDSFDCFDCNILFSKHWLDSKSILEKIRGDKVKGITWSSLLAAVIALVIATAVLLVILSRLTPKFSQAIDNAVAGVKKPICCNLFSCKPAGSDVVANINPICTLWCLNVCQ